MFSRGRLLIHQRFNTSSYLFGFNFVAFSDGFFLEFSNPECKWNAQFSFWEHGFGENGEKMALELTFVWHGQVLIPGIPNGSRLGAHICQSRHRAVS